MSMGELVDITYTLKFTREECTYEHAMFMKNGDRFYDPLGGPTYMTMFPGDYHINHSYGEFADCEEDYKRAETLYKEHIKKWHEILPQPPCDSLGWIAPNGDFYPCESYEHESVAYILAITLYDMLNGSVTIDKEGWARVAEGYVIICDTERPLKHATEKQKETALELAAYSSSEIQAYKLKCFAGIY